MHLKENSRETVCGLNWIRMELQLQLHSLGTDTPFTNELHKKGIPNTAFSKIFDRPTSEDEVGNNK
jgi:hypothetical protein